MTSGKTKTRRRYDARLKAQILAECEAPGASVAKVAMSHGINDNVVHRWRQLAREAGAVTVAATPTFVSGAASPDPAGPARRHRGHVDPPLRIGGRRMLFSRAPAVARKGRRCAMMSLIEELRQ